MHIPQFCPSKLAKVLFEDELGILMNSSGRNLNCKNSMVILVMSSCKILPLRTGLTSEYPHLYSD